MSWADRLNHEWKTIRRFVLGGHAGGAVGSMALAGTILGQSKALPAGLYIVLLLFLAGLGMSWITIVLEWRKSFYEAELDILARSRGDTSGRDDPRLSKARVNVLWLDVVNSFLLCVAVCASLVFLAAQVDWTQFPGRI